MWLRHNIQKGTKENSYHLLYNALFHLSTTQGQKNPVAGISSSQEPVPGNFLSLCSLTALWSLQSLKVWLPVQPCPVHGRKGRCHVPQCLCLGPQPPGPVGEGTSLAHQGPDPRSEGGPKTDGDIRSPGLTKEDQAWSRPQRTMAFWEHFRVSHNPQRQGLHQPCKR